MNINLFTPESSSIAPRSVDIPAATETIACPECNGQVTPLETQTGWYTCPYCQKKMQFRLWPAIRHNSIAVAAMPEQATCFFHPEKAFQACCQRCGRFVCALCDLQLGAEHVCPTCFERGRAPTGQDGGKAEWRHRDVFYDSIALAIGWGWILIWPTIVVAFPAAIFLHIKYRKAPRHYLIPRSGWRFWFAYVGLLWMPLLIAASILLTRTALKH